MRLRTPVPFLIGLALLALAGVYLGTVLARHPRLEWFKLLNIAGLTYDLLGILILSEIAANSQRVTHFFVTWVAGVLLWGQTIIPFGAAVGSWLFGFGPSSGVTTTFFFGFFAYSLPVLAVLDSLVFNHEARAGFTPIQRSRAFGLLLLLTGTLVQLIAAFRDIYA